MGETEISGGRLPRHIAIIMDGNGRWAEQRGLPRTAGHQAGVKRAREIIEECGAQSSDFIRVFH